MRTKARSVAVIVFDEVELLDVAGPLSALSVAGRRWNFRPFKIELVAPEPRLIATRSQLRFDATGALASAAPPEIAIVPGGYGARRLLEDDALAPDVRRLLATAEIVAGIGWGVAVLARAGCAGDETLAVSDEARAAVLEHAPGATLDSSAPLVASGRLITARASAAALELGLAIVGKTLGPKLCATARADLGLEPAPAPDRIELRYGAPKS